MTTKRILSSVLLTLALCSAAVAQQRLDITLTDKSVISCDLNKISYMEIVEGAPAGALDGVWYLGWKALNNGSGTKTHYNGTEVLVFTAGPKMKWIKNASESVYDLEYAGPAAGGQTFTAQREGSTIKTTYQIVTLEDELLILKQGTSRYYFYHSQEAATVATTFVTYPTRATIYTDAEKLWNAGVKGGDSSSKITPMGRHFESFAAASDEDKTWLANPSNQPDAAWLNVSGYTSWTAKTINLYPFGSPTPADVNQHSIGDCCMCAVFASFAYLYPDWIKTLIEKNGNNYTVHMFDPQGNPIDVVVDNKLMCNASGGCAQVSGKNGVFNWATIMEKALMKWETRFRCNNIGGIGTEHAAPPFTGVGSSFSFSPDKLYNSEFDLVVDYALSNGMISVGGFNVGGLVCGQLETITGHAFTVMYPDADSEYKFVMRNPWGNGGSIDGKLQIPNKREILKTIDFRLVYPGAARPYLREDLGGYSVPKFAPMDIDLHPSEEMLRMYGLKSYEPIFSQPVVGTDFVPED